MTGYKEMLARAVARVDGWANVLTGVGQVMGRRSRGSYEWQGQGRLSDAQLEDLHNGDPYAARICEAVPKHALRRGFKVKVGDVALETAVARDVARVQVVPRMREAWTWARAFGGGAVVIGADDGRLASEPLDPTALRRVLFLASVTSRELWPDTWENNSLDPRFGEPVTYRLQRNSGGGGVESSIVHHTRVVRFDGLPTTRTRRITLKGWGESYLQRTYELLQEWNGAHTAVTDLVQQASVGVYKMKRLAELIGSDPEGLLKKRMEALDMGRSVAKSILLDAEGEAYERVEVGALSGLPDLLDRYSLRLAGALEMPVSILLGRAPAGLNATGESDMRAWYDALDAEREMVLKPAVERVVRLVLLSQAGPTSAREPEGWSIEFPPLWQMTPTEQADLRGKVAATDWGNIDKGVTTPEEVAVSRFRPEGWSMETEVDLDARKASMGGAGGDPAQVDAVAAVVAKVAGREVPRETGIASLVQLLGVDAAAAEELMGETGRSFFTKPDPAAVAELETMRGENAKLKASNQGHAAYTARLIQRARDGGLELGAFTAKAPTETAEGDELEVGDVVAVPADAQVPKTNAADGPHVAIVLPLPQALRAALALPGGELPEDLHVTLVYLGPLASLPVGATDHIVSALRAWAAWASPILALIGGVGVFPAGPAGAPVYRPVDSEAIGALRPGLLRALRGEGFSPAPGHGFVPHMTVAYAPAGAPTPAPCAPLVVTFDRVALWAGDTRVEMPLGGDDDAVKGGA